MDREFEDQEYQVDFLEKRYQQDEEPKEATMDVDTPEDVGRRERREVEFV